MMSDNERKLIDYEQAVAMLPEDDQIHVYDNPAPGVLVGADWDRDELLSLMRESACELAGETATSMGHGLVVWDGKRPLFVATKGGQAVNAGERYWSERITPWDHPSNEMFSDFHAHEDCYTCWQTVGHDWDWQFPVGNEDEFRESLSEWRAARLSQEKGE